MTAYHIYKDKSSANVSRVAGTIPKAVYPISTCSIIDSRIRARGAVPQALLESCQSPVQIRGSRKEEPGSWKNSGSEEREWEAPDINDEKNEVKRRREIWKVIRILIWGPVTTSSAELNRKMNRNPSRIWSRWTIDNDIVFAKSSSACRC